MGKVKLFMKIKLNFYNEYHIGGGKGEEQADCVLLKDNENKPYIPASTMKGKLRHTIHQILKGFDKISCDVLGNEDCICPVCKLFGTGGNRQGILTFFDLKVNSDKNIKKTNKRTGIRINRLLRIVSEEALFTIETSGYSGDLVFEGEITGFLDEETYQQDILYLLIGLKMIKTLGGNQSRGLGWLDKGIDYEVYVNGEKTSNETLAKWGETIEL